MSALGLATHARRALLVASSENVHSLFVARRAYSVFAVSYSLLCSPFLFAVSSLEKPREAER
jgi:hypothetical protein